MTPNFLSALHTVCNDPLVPKLIATAYRSDAKERKIKHKQSLCDKKFVNHIVRQAVYTFVHLCVITFK